ncbi:EAL domain-containing protein [Arhodomonas aquaeolei]|uniref:sensor domain-containing protein n=1 Tax=Arhodomonas aquaeolei TaxID=2369 RepID=UPI00036BD7E9|nr:EAL domain-containing protein [Arhodomonas aquaeolei]MCS4504353.1 EAL domain-containing protein [Arhodomonas aquaeolei]
MARSEWLTRVEAMMRALPEAAVLIDGGHRVRGLNTAAAALFWERPGALRGADIRAHLGTSDTGAAVTDLTALAPGDVTAGGGGSGWLLGARCRDGSERPVRVTVSGFHEEADGRHYYFVILRPVRATDGERGHDRRWPAVFEAVQDAVFLLSAGEGEVLELNPAAGELIGYTAAEAQGLDFAGLGAEGCCGGPATFGRRLSAAAEGAPQRFEWPAQRRSGSVCWLDVSLSAVDLDGTAAVAVVARDVTERRRTDVRLRQAARVLASTREGVTITDPETRIQSVNRAFTEITGYSEAEVRGATPAILSSGHHDREFYDRMWQELVDHDQWQGEIWNRRKSGDIYPQWLTITAVRDGGGALINYVGVFSDISRIKHSEAELEQLAHYDPLTELPNRQLLNLRLEHALSRARRHGHRVALLYIDPDGFGVVNDSFGYAAGDEALCALAERVRSRLGNEDTLARLGGDQFAVMLETAPGTDGVAVIAQSIIQCFDEPIRLSSGEQVLLGVSVGISIFPDDRVDDAGTLISNADAALHQAKNEGRQTYRFYAAHLTRSAQRRLGLRSELRRAIDEHELVLHYQPIARARDGRVVGAEALVRWHHPNEGLLGPEQFIPLAEEAGLIESLGDWVLDHACGQAARWNSEGPAPLWVSVNLSAHQVHASGIERRVGAALAASGLPPDRLHLEITETVLMGSGDAVSATLQRLKRLGVHLSLDDFGTGYSSLAYLKRFAVDTLKVDRAFVQDLERDDDDAQIVSTIAAMAHNLGLEVIAEGVETPGQAEHLRRLGCDYLQGFLLARPAPADVFAQRLAAAGRDEWDEQHGA